MDRVRTARTADGVRLAEIEIVNYRQNFYPLFRSDAYFFSELTVPVLIDEYRRMPERVAQTFVYDDGIVKGFVRVNGAEIEKLFVEPVFQNGGIGAALIARAVEAGGKRLLVLEKNPRAIRFYERHGFCRTDERQRVDDTNEFFIRMAYKA